MTRTWYSELEDSVLDDLGLGTRDFQSNPLVTLFKLCHSQ